MDEYISRSYVRKMAMLEMAYTMETETDSAVVLRLIDDAPAADVAPVRHGRRVNYSGFYCRCSQCEGTLPVCSNYCPNCGAQMDGARNGEED